MAWIKTINYRKVILFLVLLLPFLALFFKDFGANPIEYLIRYTGDWGYRILLLTLAVTPLRRLTGWHKLAQYRRMIGLFGFAYIALHLFIYIAVDQGFAWDEIVKAIIKRPFITFGMAGFVIMIPLAITSWNRMIKWMGGRNWQRLHRAVYVAIFAGAVHYYMMAKADKFEPLVYGGILAVLLLMRLVPLPNLVDKFKRKA
ncbi:MAG: protein-methionine-sulfoxide reductase heme-binding subunit MsrQ [Candidatus Symbiobacter sp.]|nr:protein-methionine-sulfoxide reductase heme-binding subunit MsrQ [Candidatus Symbiobacter sp.]